MRIYSTRKSQFLTSFFIFFKFGQSQLFYFFIYFLIGSVGPSVNFIFSFVSSAFSLDSLPDFIFSFVSHTPHTRGHGRAADSNGMGQPGSEFGLELRGCAASFISISLHTQPYIYQSIPKKTHGELFIDFLGMFGKRVVQIS